MMMLKEAFLVLATLTVLTSGRMAGILAGGFRINPGFSCEGRLHGFYADVANNCSAYHVCDPIVDENGELTEMAHYSFLCGQKTVFDQQLLLCNHGQDAFPCADSESIYEDTNLQLRQEIEAKEEEAKLRKAITVTN